MLFYLILPKYSFNWCGSIFMYFYAARQPILDRNKELVGYELLFRDGVDNVFPDIDGDEATTRLV